MGSTHQCDETGASCRKKLPAQCIAKPGTGIRPFLPGFVDRDAERGGDLLVTQAPEMTQFHDLGDRRVFCRQAQ